MPKTAEQLADAQTAEFVAHRGLLEALINRVTSIVATEQVERLKLQEQVDEVLRRLTALEERTAEHAAQANEQRAHIMAQLGRLEAPERHAGEERRAGSGDRRGAS